MRIANWPPRAKPAPGTTFIFSVNGQGSRKVRVCHIIFRCKGRHASDWAKAIGSSISDPVGDVVEDAARLQREPSSIGGASHRVNAFRGPKTFRGPCYGKRWLTIYSTTKRIRPIPRLQATSFFSTGSNGSYSCCIFCSCSRILGSSAIDGGRC